jgi:uncharacterized protein (DUF1501 family)
MSSSPISRRRFLQAGGIGALTLGVPGLVAARVDGERSLGSGAADKSCIFLLLCGGPSHLDTWDPKPEAPEGIRGPYRPIATAVPGMRICELAPRLAARSRRFSVIRSMMHVGNISNHFDAMHHLLSGEAGAPPDAPYLGSILSRVRAGGGGRQHAASYVWLIRCVGDPVFCAPNIGTGGHLGAQHSPLFIGSAANHPAMPNFRGPEDLFGPSDPARMQSRRRLLDRLDPDQDDRRTTREWHELHQRAMELANGPGGRQVFELHRESPIVRDRYGMHPLGQNLLLARRLIEAGVGCVTVNGWTGPAPGAGGGPPSSSWDMHGGHMGMGNAFGSGSYGMGWCLPRLDEALSALLDDLHERGLLERTLVVVIGEFGRSPRIYTQGEPGRIHWPDCYSGLIAGGGIRGGMVYGQSDRIGAYVRDRPVRMQDLGATIYHALDVPLDVRLGRDGFTRPITTGQPILDLFG